MTSWMTDHDHPEYRYMWDALAKHPLNRGLPDPMVAINKGSYEAWQYMSTWSKDGKVAHEFRHRDHPRTGERIVIRIPVSPAYDDQPIVYEEVFGGSKHDPF